MTKCSPDLSGCALTAMLSGFRPVVRQAVFLRDSSRTRPMIERLDGTIDHCGAVRTLI